MKALLIPSGAVCILSDYDCKSYLSKNYRVITSRFIVFLHLFCVTVVLFTPSSI